ncbi:putative polysaccharide biosynthesis protein [Senegalia massiliensis]|uniref:putative polysaccharide biosynthesis protein n=1 Tax=Senegalia massiliensis TaxID=1720316 RepID=UPI001030F556|nr:polysaccharide biosynthesis protein [Senegalia massiliensis]
MNKIKFIYGAIILALVNFLVRAMGFGYKIILSKIIGAKGIGLFQLINPILMLFLTITTAGLPIAVTKLVAKQEAKNNSLASKQILKTSIYITILFSLILSLILFLLSPFISSNILKNKDTLYFLYFLIPAILLISLSSVTRGYFYGLKKMGISGSSQIIEQIIRIVFVLLYLYFSYPIDSTWGAFIALLGISVGEFFGLLWLFLNYNIINFKSKKNIVNKKLSLKEIITSLFFIAMPITISQFFHVLLQISNTILIPRRLILAGYTMEQSLETFGRVVGMAMPFVFLPFIFTGALVMNIIPNISEQISKNNLYDVEKSSSLCLRITFILTIPITLIYIFYSIPITNFVYNDVLVGRYLYVLSYSTIFLSLHHTASGILHGLGKQIQASINHFIGMSIQLLATFFLVSNPNYGIYGFLIGFLVCSIVMFSLDFITLKKYIKIKWDITNFILKPVISGAIMLQFIKLGYYFINYFDLNQFYIILNYLISIFIYFILLIITKALPINIILKLLSKKRHK